MPDYLLTSEWKKTLKAHPDVKNVDDLTKALDAYAKVKDNPEKELAALKTVTTEAKELKGKNAKNKDLAEYLGDILGAADKAEREAEKELEAAKKKAAEPDVDTELLKQLKITRTARPEKPRYFVVALGKPAGLCISKIPSTRKQKAHARTYRKGKGKLLLGRCFGESGKFVFELEDKPISGLAKLLKSAVKLQCGVAIKVNVRGGGVDLDDETDLDEVADLGEDAPDEDDAPGAEDEGEEDEDEDEGEDVPTDPAAIEGRLKAALQRAVGLGLAPEVLKEIKLNASEVNALLRQKDLAGASRKLDALEAKLAPQSTGGGTEADPRIVARANDLSKLLDSLARESPDAVAPLRGFLAEARAAALDGWTDDADEILDRVEARAKGVARAAKAAREIAEAGPTRTVGFKVAREGWNQARQLARVQMTKFSNALLSDDKAKAQPNWKDIEAGAQNLVPMLDVFDDSLAQAIQDAETATDPALIRDHLQDAAALISDYRQELSTNPIYGVMDNGAYGTFKVHDLLSRSLDQAAAKLGV